MADGSARKQLRMHVVLRSVLFCPDGSRPPGPPGHVFVATQKESVLRRTSHRPTARPVPRKAAAGALVAVAALLAAAVQTGAATADAPPAPGKLDKGSLSVKLSPPSAPRC